MRSNSSAPWPSCTCIPSVSKSCPFLSSFGGPNTNATRAHARTRAHEFGPFRLLIRAPLSLPPSVSTRIIHQARIVRTPICTTSTVIALPSSLAIPSSCRVRVARGFSSGPPHLLALSFPFLAGQLSIKDEHFRGAGGYWQSYFCMHHDVSTMRPGYKGISQKWA